jgi:hypothetical protein
MNFTGSGAAKSDIERQQDSQSTTCCQKLRNTVLVGTYGAGWSFMMYHFWAPIVSVPVFAGVTIGWLVFTAILLYCVHVKKWTFGGVDQRFFDIFNIPHFLFGVVMGMDGLPFVYTLAATIVWEFVEISTVEFGEKESLLNRFGDIVMACGAWFLVRGLTVHTFPMF